METRKIPETDLEVSRLALGSMGLGGGWIADTKLTTDHERQAREFLDAAEEIGANFPDHANIYGRGRAEDVFGRVLKERPSLRDRIVLQSKCGIRWADDPPRNTLPLWLQPRPRNPSQAGELPWTGVKVHGWLKEQLGLEVGYSTTVRYLHELGYNLGTYSRRRS